MELMLQYWAQLPVAGQAFAKVMAVLMPLLIAVAWLPYAERKIIGYMQIRIGPNRVGPRGWFQPFASLLRRVLLGCFPRTCS